MKYALSFILTIYSCTLSFAQNYNQEQTTLRNFLVRMYQASPFEGVKVVSDYENDYLFSVVLVDKSSGSEIKMNRIAQVKNSRQVSQFLKGLISFKSQTIIPIAKNVKENRTVEEVIDIIQESSIGYTQSMEILTKINNKDDNNMSYLFIKKINKNKQ